jgi:deaminated glutathione amidase
MSAEMSAETSGAFTVACIQTNSEREFAPNIRIVGDLVRRSRDAGAELILTPEVVGMLEPKRERHLEKATGEADNPALAAFRELARETGAWLLAGSLAIRLEADDAQIGRLANRSFLIAPDGAIAARYDKIHMFDIDLPNGERYRESNLYRPGEATVLASLPWGTLGMTVCYDLRFPHLYRALAQAGADFISVPSSFTVPTGRAHWHVLLRARAIETGCFVFAPAQTGEHAEGRKTYGHSLIVDPWGEVLADAGADIGFVTAVIDPARIAEVRAMVPSLQHDRAIPAPRLMSSRGASDDRGRRP